MCGIYLHKLTSADIVKKLFQNNFFAINRGYEQQRTFPE